MISNMPEGYVEVYYDRVLLDVKSKEAVLFLIDGKEVWIPRSQIDDQFPEDKLLLVTEWFAIKKRLI